MRSISFRRQLQKGAALALIFLGTSALAEPKHGIAMYGEPALPPDFVSLPYANPDAPKGGRFVTGNNGGFDSLNPYIRQGSVPWQLRFFASESLMGRSRGEPFGLYGLLAETIETGPNREWVEFTLRPEAKFWDGTPVTVEDVIWSYETLGTVGHPRYLGFWKKVDKIEQTGDRSVRLTFNVEDRELALIAGLRPILKKAQWEGKDINDSTLQDVPMTTSPYMVTDFEANRYVTLTRNPDYWGKDVPFRRGTHNFDEIRIDFYGDGSVLFEAFKAGEFSYFREFNAESWASNYNFDRVENGDIIKAEIPHQKPSGITGLVLNTRNAPLDDIRVRDALTHAFNFEFINDTLTGGRQPRITSFFSNSILSMDHGPAEGRVADFLAPYADVLPEGAIEGYTLPVSDGTARNRSNIRKATALMAEAGYTVQDGVMTSADGKPFELNVLLRQGDTETATVVDIYQGALDRLGIKLNIDVVDGAQHTERTNSFDFDMAYYRRAVSLSPGNEQNLYWGSAAADQPGSRNQMGAKSPAIDGLINEMLNAKDQEDFVAATKALDRTLTAGRYVIPFWNFAVGRIAHVKEIKYPETLPIYGDGVDWMPHSWWYEDK
ncbi:extracellular solute-binding protein [Cognatishimia sp. 1_MG-2023]|uniref:extracellular solute-binding protein n=1 Tax=Cognatishimia sp. 1_MG-2023 TaxID=3062642 RepID=UPI0026E1158E|nr:extracellular solute-binding protein [Cognatishimia sp. 1_MG-2023]MDO6725416.1 extracellular solute-binding protein [Cognatishimia sp. 1_MG-2023]